MLRPELNPEPECSGLVGCDPWVVIPGILKDLSTFIGGVGQESFKRHAGFRQYYTSAQVKQCI